jgi:hypothetical protein
MISLRLNQPSVSATMMVLAVLSVPCTANPVSLFVRLSSLAAWQSNLLSLFFPVELLERIASGQISRSGCAIIGRGMRQNNFFSLITHTLLVDAQPEVLRVS